MVRMTTSMALAYVLVILLCILSSIHGQCFSEVQYNAAAVPVSSLQDSTAEFAPNIFKTAVQSNSGGNIFLSPISIWFALMSTYFGAKNSTSDELAKALGVSGLDKDSLGYAYQQFKSQFQSNQDPKNILRIANKLYFQLGSPLFNCVKRYFGSEIELLDFAISPDASRNKINAWVEEKTNRQIQNLLPSGVITSLTRAVIANAAYFKGEWLIQFDESKTSKSDFFQNPANVNSKITVDMMRLKDKVLYVKSSNLLCTAVELLYAGKEVSMVALLPKGEDSAEDLANRITKPGLEILYSTMEMQSIRLFLPKFRIEHATELNDLLSSLGVNEMFKQGKADLSGFNGDNTLYMSKLLHKAFVEVNEQGTEAAAATAGVIQTYSAPSEPIVEFNRPFVFLIRHRQSNAILFMGIVRQPQV